MPRVLVTGASGFIGSAVIAELCRTPNLVVRALDLQAPSHRTGVEVVTGSILDVNDISRAVHECDVVIHLAAILGVQRTEANPLECLQVNVQGTVHLLEACIKEGVKRFVFASSSEVYGEPASLPVSEATPLNPRSVYANTKLAGEEYVRAYAQRYNIEYSIARFFNVYGPRQVAEFVMPRFIREVMAGREPVVHGNGDQVRAFCYVEDAARAAAQIAVTPEAAGQVFNIGNPTEPITMKELAYRVIRVLGAKHQPKFISLDQVSRGNGREIVSRVPSIDKAKALLGYRPSVSLDEGIRKVATGGKIQDTWERIRESASLDALLQ